MKFNNIDIYLERHGQGAPLVLLHGGPGLGHDYFKPAFLEVSQYAEVIFYDQRCCGKSQFLPLGECCELALHLEDLKAIISTLGLKDIIVLGHSFGAYLALAFAVRHSDVISKLILVSPVLPYAEPPVQIHRWFSFFTPEIRRRLDKITMSNEPSGIKSLKRLDITLPLYFHQHDALKEFRNRNFPLKGEVIEECSKKSMVVDLRDDIARLTMPVTLIVGMEDKRTPPGYANELSKHLKDSKVIEMKDTGHFPFIERRQKFLEILKSELTQNNPEQNHDTAER